MLFLNDRRNEGLLVDGKWPADTDIDLLNISVKNGAISTAVFFITDTGIGPAAQLLSDARRTAQTTSAVFSSVNPDSCVLKIRLVNVGSGDMSGSRQHCVDVFHKKSK